MFAAIHRLFNEGLVEADMVDNFGAHVKHMVEASTSDEEKVNMANMFLGSLNAAYDAGDIQQATGGRRRGRDLLNHDPSHDFDDLRAHDVGAAELLADHVDAQTKHLWTLLENGRSFLLVEETRKVSAKEKEGYFDFDFDVVQQQDRAGAVHSLRGGLGAAGIPARPPPRPRAHQTRRQLLDTFGDSLVHVNMLYHQKFGKVDKNRKVPAHMPHMIDRVFAQEMMDAFPGEWNATSSHRFRSSKDMQYGFAYFYWLIHRHELRELDLQGMFETYLDTNSDGYLDENELLTLASIAFGSPPTEGFVKKVTQCVQPPIETEEKIVTAAGTELIKKTTLPHVTIGQIAACEEVMAQLKEHRRKPNQPIMMEQDEIAFEMIGPSFLLPLLASFLSRRLIIRAS